MGVILPAAPAEAASKSVSATAWAALPCCAVSRINASTRLAPAIAAIAAVHAYAPVAASVTTVNPERSSFNAATRARMLSSRSAGGERRTRLSGNGRSMQHGFTSKLACVCRKRRATRSSSRIHLRQLRVMPSSATARGHGNASCPRREPRERASVFQTPSARRAAG